MFGQQLNHLSCAGLLAVALAGGACGAEGNCSADVRATLDAYVPSGMPVNCSNAMTFQVEGRQVRMTHVEYGLSPGAGSAWGPSVVCAIEDPAVAEPELFYALWFKGSPLRPEALMIECPNLPSTANETWPTCVPSGLRNPVVATSAFQSWAEEQFQTSGPFRFCVLHYAPNDSWP